MRGSCFSSAGAGCYFPFLTERSQAIPPRSGCECKAAFPGPALGFTA